MIKKITCVCFFLLLFPNFLPAQIEWKPGFVITQNADTIYGYIENLETRSLSRNCHFRVSESAETRIFSPGDILGYRFSDGRYFISMYVDGLGQGRPVFLEFLVQGEISFYHYFDSGSRYFILNDGVFTELTITTDTFTQEGREYAFTRKDFRGMLSYYLKDANMMKEINRANLTPRSLINLAETYQAQVCPDEECIVYSKSLLRVKIIPGFHAGFTSNRISFGRRLDSDFGANFNIGFRLRFENMIAWNENIILETGLNLHRFSQYTLSAGKINIRQPEWFRYKGDHIILERLSWLNPSVTSARVNLNTTLINIPVVALYRFPRRNISPFAGIGMSNMIVLSQTDEMYYHYFNRRYNKLIPGYLMGFMAKTGTTIPMNNSVNLLVELIFEHSQSMDLNQMLRFRNNQFSLNFGVLL